MVSHVFVLNLWICCQPTHPIYMIYKTEGVSWEILIIDESSRHWGHLYWNLEDRFNISCVVVLFVSQVQVKIFHRLSKQMNSSLHKDRVISFRFTTSSNLPCVASKALMSFEPKPHSWSCSGLWERSIGQINSCFACLECRVRPVQPVTKPSTPAIKEEDNVGGGEAIRFSVTLYMIRKTPTVWDFDNYASTYSHRLWKFMPEYIHYTVFAREPTLVNFNRVH